MFKLALSPASRADVQPVAPLGAWVRWAVCLSFLAIFCLLLAPASLLAQDLKTGKLGGVCTVAKAPSAPDGTGDEASADSAHGHCPLCSVSWGLPPAASQLALPSWGAPAGTASVRADPAARVTGLPFSRAPPARA